MPITLDQAKAFEAVADCGSIAKASEKLNKAHSAVIYAIKSIENDLNLKLLDRSQYRGTLTSEGKRVLEKCRQLLAAAKELELLSNDMNSGWEPHVRVVYEGVLPFDPVVKVLSMLSKKNMPTKIEIFTKFHRNVEAAFIEKDAHIMISVIPPQLVTLESIKLSPLKMFLVARSDHPLVRGKKRKTLADLRNFPFLIVQGSDRRLNLSTGVLDETSSFHMSDFNSKKAVIMSGIGFGWMPECLIEEELKSKKMRIVRWEHSSVHLLQPYLYHRGTRHLGKAASIFLKEFMNFESKPLCEACAKNLKHEDC